MKRLRFGCDLSRLLGVLLLGLMVSLPAGPTWASEEPAAGEDDETSSPTEAPADDTPDAETILDRMDRALQFDTRTARVTMEVVEGRRTRRYEMMTYGRGVTDAAVEYEAPARERGTRMLKLGDNLWIYLPRAERVQRISGHMLRQGMMGSDISYEDMMQAAEFRRQYEARVLGAEEVDGRKCWKIEATARDRKVTYPRRLIWVDQENYVPLRQKLFALSGMQLKTWAMSDVREVDGRSTPHRMKLTDALREGSKTTLTLSEIRYGVTFRDEVFTMRWLERR